MPDEIPKLKLPVTLVGSKLDTIEQDTDDEVVQCVETVCRFPIGQRDDLLEFGIGSYELRNINDISAAELAREITRWEPRAQLTADGRFGTVASEYIIDLLVRRRA